MYEMLLIGSVPNLKKNTAVNFKKNAESKKNILDNIVIKAFSSW